MQTWLVQIPPGVDITKAKEIKDGEFQIGKSTYTLSRAPVSIGDCMTLEEKDGVYTQISGPTQLMELTKSVSLPKIDKSVKESKPLVPQRLNLKARHFATGYAAEAEKTQKRHNREADVVGSTPKKQKLSSSDAVKTPKSERKKKSEKTPKSEKKEKKEKKDKSEKKKKSKSE